MEIKNNKLTTKLFTNLGEVGKLIVLLLLLISAVPVYAFQVGKSHDEKSIAKLNENPDAAVMILVVMAWHGRGDMDLHIIDPAGNAYYFEETTHPGNSGELSQDSTVGPGIEIFEVLEPIHGDWEIRFNSYDGQFFGDVTGTIYTGNGDRVHLAPVHFSRNQVTSQNQGVADLAATSEARETKLAGKFRVFEDGSFEMISGQR